MSNQIELRHIKYFLATAEELHFRKASEKLYISQPGLSRQIKQMEQELGIKLFDRHNRQVLLTTAGKYLQTELQLQMQSLNDTFDHAKQLDRGRRGNLKFGYVGSAIEKTIPDLLVQMRDRYPDIIYNLSEMNNQTQVQNLISEEIDLGFVRLDRVPRGLEMYPVLTEPFCLVLPADHPLANEPINNLDQFKEEPFILFNKKYSDSYYNKVMDIFDSMGFVPIISHNTIHASSIYKLVEHKFGISIVPKSLTYTHNPKVKFISLDSIPQRAILSIAWKSENRNLLVDNVLNLICG